MNKSTVSLAIASLLASAGASATNFDIWVTGASAQRTFWSKDVAANLCGGAANMTTYTVTGPSNAPDNAAYRCVVNATPAIAGVVNGTDVLTLHYSAELGSIGGISQFLPGRPSTRLYVNPDGLDCPAPVANASKCVIASYDGSADAFTSTNSDALIPHAADVGVTDMEPKHWTNSVNWPANGWVNPGAVATQVTPTSTDLASLTPAPSPVNGQLFAAIVNNAGPLAAGGNISKASFAAIISGKYATWGQVPEVAGGNTTPIVLCRRDVGSGTQVAASVFTVGFECGRSTTNLASIASPGALSAANIFENPSTSALRTCVQNNTGAIGFASISLSANYTTLRMDGVQANAHNAAAGMYPYAFESFVYNKSASTQGAPVSTIVSALITRAKSAATLPAAETGSVQAAGNANGVGAGQWYTTAPTSNYAVPGGGFGNNAFQSAASWAGNTTTAVTAMAYRSGDNCKLLLDNNAL